MIVLVIPVGVCRVFSNGCVYGGARYSGFSFYNRLPVGFDLVLFLFSAFLPISSKVALLNVDSSLVWGSSFGCGLVAGASTFSS